MRSSKTLDTFPKETMHCKHCLNLDTWSNQTKDFGTVTIKTNRENHTLMTLMLILCEEVMYDYIMKIGKGK